MGGKYACEGGINTRKERSTGQGKPRPVLTVRTDEKKQKNHNPGYIIDFFFIANRV